MPPKKAKAAEDDSMVSNASVEDYLLPKSMVQRLAKGVLPANTSISKDSLTAVLKSTTVFVNYIASNANDRAVLSNHKVIKPEDVFEALKEMEFEAFVPRVREEHDKYVQIQNDKRNDYRKRIKDDKVEDAKAEASLTGEAPADYENTQANGDRSMTDMNGNYGHDDEGPASKRPRLSGTGGEIAGQPTHGDTTEDEGDAPEPGDGDTEPEDEEVEEEEDDEEEEFADAEEGQNTMEDDLGGGVEVDDSNHYRRDADEDSGEDDY